MHCVSYASHNDLSIQLHVLALDHGPYEMRTKVFHSGSCLKRRTQTVAEVDASRWNFAGRCEVFSMYTYITTCH